MGDVTSMGLQDYEVERVGVGRMLKDVWSKVDIYEDLILTQCDIDPKREAQDHSAL